MYKVDQNKENISFCISSEYQFVDRIIEDTNSFLNESMFTMNYNFRLCFREILINALEHGNKEDPEKEIKCNINIKKNNIAELIITDQGNGFNYGNIQTSIPESSENIRRKGFPIIYSIAEKVAFNKKGNAIKAYIKMDDLKKTNFYINTNAMPVQIIPNVELTAKHANDFRITLIRLYDKGYQEFQLNLINVREIDSINLAVLLSFGKMLYMNGYKNQPEIITSTEEIASLLRMMGFMQFFNIKHKQGV